MPNPKKKQIDSASYYDDMLLDNDSPDVYEKISHGTELMQTSPDFYQSRIIHPNSNKNEKIPKKYIEEYKKYAEKTHDIDKYADDDLYDVPEARSNNASLKRKYGKKSHKIIYNIHSSHYEMNFLPKYQ